MSILETAPWAAFCVMSSCDHTDCPSYARKDFKAAINLPIGELAKRVHERRCSMWIQQLHGGVYVAMAIRCCGENGQRHIDWYAKTKWLTELHARFNPTLFEVES